jgi:hypothetical protein
MDFLSVPQSYCYLQTINILNTIIKVEAVVNLEQRLRNLKPIVKQRNLVVL